MAPTTVIAAMIFLFLLVLWLYGFSKLDQDGHGVVGGLTAVVAFIAGVVVFWTQWHARDQGQPAVVALFFLFMCIVGSFQLGLSTQALASGFIRPTDSGGVAPTSLYLLLLVPDGSAIYFSERPLRFLIELVGRALIGLALTFFLTTIPWIGRLGHHT